MSNFVISAASGVHEVARKGVRAIEYDGRALSSATFQSNRAPHSFVVAHDSVVMCDSAVSGSDVQPLPGAG